MADCLLLALPDAALKRVLSTGGALVIVDTTIACRQTRDAARRFFMPDEMERVRIEAICCAMEQSPDVVAVQEDACKGLWDHIDRSPRPARARQIAESAGAIGLIGAAMRRHDDSLYMNYIGCFTTMNFLSPHLPESGEASAGPPPPIWNFIENAGIIESVVTALGTFAEDRPALVQACNLLSCLTGAYHGAAERRRRAVQAGAIPAAVAVIANNLNDDDEEDDLTRHFDDGRASVQSNACWLLANLGNVDRALVDANPAQLMIDAGGFEAIVLAMLTNQGNEDVMEEAGRALLNFVMFAGDEGGLLQEARARILEAGGEAMIRSLRAIERAQPIGYNEVPGLSVSERLAFWLNLELGQ